tara:strand:- start:192 stop:347 length:156 start_codon:yes stop_codon:yes gene_type:complete
MNLSPEVVENEEPPIIVKINKKKAKPLKLSPRPKPIFERLLTIEKNKFENK